jgi:hypothetical protein
MKMRDEIWTNLVKEIGDVKPKCRSNQVGAPGDDGAS